MSDIEIKDNGGKKVDTSNAFDFSQFDDMFSDMNSSSEPKQQAHVEPVKEAPNNITIQDTGSSLKTDPALIQSGIVKMQNIATEMNNLFVEREDLVRIMELALVTKTNVLMLGKPGTARI